MESNEVTNTGPFLPQLTRSAYAQLRDVVGGAADAKDLQCRLTVHAAEVERQGGQEAKRVRAAALVLLDLARQAWAIYVEGDTIWTSASVGQPLHGEGPEQAKARTRAALLAFRAIQLADPAVRAFLTGMERPRGLEGKRSSVLDLIDDGHELSLRLADAARLPPVHRAQALAEIVRPVIQVAARGELCEHTGLDLYDIWRYFRHTWSLEYRPTPGRSLAFLVRNAARPGAPVMGIASVANAAMQLRVRDNWIGWSSAAVEESLKTDPAGWPELRAMFQETVREARANIRHDDLMKRAGRGVEGEQLEQRLRGIAEAAKAQRLLDLRDRQVRLERGEEVASLRALPLGDDGDVDWRAASEDALFVAKRAATAADLLMAARWLEKLPDDAEAALRFMHEEERARRALAVAAKEVRKVGLSSRLLDVNVCGAVPPYRPLLAGKLVALSIGSLEVFDAYVSRYKGQVSHIASQISARPVTRSPEAVLFTTTSLYGASASQYNRLKVDVELPTGGATTMRWRDLGFTEGWGTTHFSEATLRALREASSKRNVNNRFGEGQSPRLRQAREGLAELGLDPETYLKHRHARRVYALEPIEEAREALRLNRAAPKERPSLQAIAAAWRSRWLERRITNPRVRHEVAVQGPGMVLRELAAPPGPQLSLFKPREELGGGDHEFNLEWGRSMADAETSSPRLIQSLYRALGACADHHDAETVARLHIETPVDQFLRDRAPGRVVFVTGNPGDGKTHLLRRLSTELRQAKIDVCLDANEIANIELIKMVRRALRPGTKGLAIAINEGILLDLLREAGSEEWAPTVRERLLNPLRYREDESEGGEEDRLVVLDLNLRNNLSSSIVRSALGGLLAMSAPCKECPGRVGCTLQANAVRLQDPSIAKRMGDLLDAIARVGVHATMRDLQGFLSYLLAGGRNCEDEAKQVAPYWQSAFEGGAGALFDAARRFDPAARTHPFLDDQLWRKADEERDWQLPWERDCKHNAPLDDRMQEFRFTKRRALFEHRKGAALLRSSSRVDEVLGELLKGGSSAVRRCVRLLNRFFDRNDDEADLLRLWMTHRYDADVPKQAAAMDIIPSPDLEMLTPSLRPSLQPAFPDYRPDHAILVARELHPAQGLRIDRSLVEALLAAERGLPSPFRRGEPEARIGSFVNKLAKLKMDDPAPNELTVRLVERDTGGKVEVTVDVADRKYVGGRA